MPAEIDRREMQRLLSEEGAQLVEVLPEDESGSDDRLIGLVMRDDLEAGSCRPRARA
jgi:hypothetical protein